MKSFFKSNLRLMQATQWFSSQRLILLPGIVLAGLIAGLALLLSQRLGLQELNPLLLAVVLGMG
ncbi:MAG: hypothetical protein AAFU71_02375, partial [Cyanobacteria bacterium J06632_22]